MNTYTYSEARQKLSSLLKKAKSEGRVLITRKDGSIFELKPFIDKTSPLNVKGVNTKIDREEIIDILNEVREKD